MKDAGIAAITGNQTTYTNPSGTSDIKTEIAKFMNRTRNLEGAEEIRASEVVVGPGAKPPLFFACQCLLQPGDEMIIPDPGFPVYKAIAQSCCCTYKFVPWKIRTFDLEVFEAALNEKTRVVIINSPSNPTGGVMPKEDLDKVMALCEKFPKCWVVSDEIYSQLTYDSMGTPPSALNCEPTHPRPCGSQASARAAAHRVRVRWPDPSMRQRVIAVDGFSKTYCMTGWRLGWVRHKTPFHNSRGPGPALKPGSVWTPGDDAAVARRPLPPVHDARHRLLRLLHPDRWHRGAGGPAGRHRDDAGGVREAAQLRRGEAERHAHGQLRQPGGRLLRCASSPPLGVASWVSQLP